jgi:hypothetical protein
VLLVTIHDPQVGGLGQVMAAVATPGRVAIHLLGRVVNPRQIRAGAPRLLTPLALGSGSRRFGFAAGGVRPGSSSFEDGIEELLELRVNRCSSRASFAASSSLASNRSATCVDNVAICAS